MIQAAESPLNETLKISTNFVETLFHFSFPSIDFNLNFFLFFFFLCIMVIACDFLLLDIFFYFFRIKMKCGLSTSFQTEGSNITDEEIRGAEDKFAESLLLAQTGMYNLLANDVSLDFYLD